MYKMVHDDYYDLQLLWYWASSCAWALLCPISLRLLWCFKSQEAEHNKRQCLYCRLPALCSVCRLPCRQGLWWAVTNTSSGYKSDYNGIIFSSHLTTGNFIVQTISIVVSASGLFLLTFSTWQLTLDQPHCCSEANHSSMMALFDQSGISSQHWSAANCSELNKITVLEHHGFGISPAINITLAIIGLMVRLHAFSFPNSH